jgi:hypothetical protein
MSQSLADANLSQTVERILPYFSKLYFFNRLHRERKFVVVKRQAVSGLKKEGKEIVLNAQDFSLLWLIGTLATESHDSVPSMYCEQTLVQQFYLWRRSPEDHDEAVTANNRFNFLMKRLMAVDLIDYEDHPETKRKHAIYLKPKGTALLQDLKDERAKQLIRVLGLGKLKRTEQNRLVREFGGMAQKAWEILHTEIESEKL